MAKKHNAPAKPALEPNEALFQAVSLCRKAGALTMGFDAVAICTPKIQSATMATIR